MYVVALWYQVEAAEVYWQQHIVQVGYGGHKRTEHQSAQKKTQKQKNKQTVKFGHGVLLVRSAPAADLPLPYT